MLSEQKKEQKITKNLLSSEGNQIHYKIDDKSNINKLPPVNQQKNISTKIKTSSLASSINILYKSLFPDEKNTLDNFLNNYPKKYLKQPKWKFTITKTRNDDKIRKELMQKNRTMRSYEYLRKPTKLKHNIIIKPKMVRIVEDNLSYKYRYFLNPWEEEYNLYRQSKNKGSQLNLNLITNKLF